MSAVQALKLLAPEDTDHKLANAFIEQLAFNVMLGNADAHAKNYSVMLRPSGIEMSPMYDIVPVGLYPFDQKLAMDISGADRSQSVELPHWRKLALKADLDPDEVLERVTGIATGIAETVDTAWVELDEDQQKQLREQLLRNTDKILGGAGGRKLSMTEPRARNGWIRNKDVGVTGNGGSFAPDSKPEAG